MGGVDCYKNEWLHNSSVPSRVEACRRRRLPPIASHGDQALEHAAGSIYHALYGLSSVLWCLLRLRDVAIKVLEPRLSGGKGVSADRSVAAPRTSSLHPTSTSLDLMFSMTLWMRRIACHFPPSWTPAHGRSAVMCMRQWCYWWDVMGLMAMDNFLRAWRYDM